MSEIEDFNEGQFLYELMKFSNEIYTEEASGIASDFFELMLKDPVKGIRDIPSFINKIRKMSPDSSFVEAVAGGPNQDWTSMALNVLGIFYPRLEKEVRKEGLIYTFNFLNGLNYLTAQLNVELINEPWLVADIVINQPLYWCGYKEYCDLLQEKKSWADFSKHTRSPKSEFWMAVAVTRPKYSSLEVRTNFYKEFPDLMDRTKDAIAAIIYNDALHSNKYKGTNIDKYIKEHLIKYDGLLIDDIKEKMDEKKWIKLENSLYPY